MDFVNELQKRGKRITYAREVVCKILETSGHKHFTVEELHKLSLKKDKNIDLATVYRTLELLESINLIEHSHQVHGSGLYFVIIFDVSEILSASNSSILILQLFFFFICF